MTPGKSLAAHFRVTEELEIQPRYNIAPTQLAAIVRNDPDSASREMRSFKWGLVPFWAKDPSIGPRLINARSETVAEKPAFRTAFKKRRCLVPANGFYEWKKVQKEKQPYFFALSDQRVFAFAGLWEKWEGPAGQIIESFTMLTVAANELLAAIHDRMPLILAEQDYDLWLDTSVDRLHLLKPLLRAYPADQMTAHPVSRRVNKSDYDRADLIEPLDAFSAKS